MSGQEGAKMEMMYDDMRSIDHSRLKSMSRVAPTSYLGLPRMPLLE